MHSPAAHKVPATLKVRTALRAVLPPRTSILLVVHNGARFLPDLLASLRDQSDRDYELVVVDNASSDESADVVATAFPEAVVVRSPRNLGFTGGNNLAARRARGEFLVLLNQDAVVARDWLEHLVAAMGGRVGCAQSKVLLHDAPGTLNAVGCGMNYLLFGWALRNGEPDDVQGEPFEVPYAMGAALCVRRDLFLEVGGFDDRLWMYHDDLELGLKVRLRGRVCVCVPASRVFHRYEPDGVGGVAGKMYLYERNRRVMLHRYYSPRTRRLLWPVRVVVEAGVLWVALVQGWLPAKLRARRDARRILREGRPPLGVAYRDADLLRMLGCDFSSAHMTGPRVEAWARGVMAAYFRFVVRFL